MNRYLAYQKEKMNKQLEKEEIEHAVMSYGKINTNDD